MICDTKSTLCDGDLLHGLLSLNLVDEALNVVQALLEYRVELTVTETERNPSVDVEVLDAVDIRHLDDQIMKSGQ